MGLGAVLAQKQANGKESVIAYASRTLSKSEKQYDAHKLEFLSLKWAITDRFHEYLYRGDFEVYTDNNPLTYVLTTAKLDATGQRWVAALAMYNFKIYYRSGKLNANADALLQIPWETSEIIDSKVLEPYVVKAIMMKSDWISWPLEESIIAKAAHFFAPDYAPQMSWSEWQQEQKADENIAKVIDLIEKDELRKYHVWKNDNYEFRNYMKLRKYLVLEGGLLFRTVQLKHQVKPIDQLVIPYKFRKRMVLACHDEMGHLGMDHTLLVLQDRVYWPGMSKDIRNHIRTCGRCEWFKQLPSTEEISQTKASYPLELVHVDFLIIGGKKDVRKDINILVVTDHFTRYAQAYVTTSQTAVTAAKTLYEYFFTQYRWPTKLITDQGSCFESRLFQSLMKEAKIRKICTTLYRPQGNAQVERFNRTLQNMLGTMPIDQKKNCQDWVSTMTHAYNSTVCRSTAYSPYFLMFGREPRLPIDDEFNFPNRKESATVHTYVERLLNKLDVAFCKARENIARDASARKKFCDCNVCCHELQPGDIVLVRKNLFDSNYKIADKWEEEPYMVESQMGDTPVYLFTVWCR